MAYEYYGIYIDCLAIMTNDPVFTCGELRTKCAFNLEGNGPLNLHLGSSYSTNSDGSQEIC